MYTPQGYLSGGILERHFFIPKKKVINYKSMVRIKYVEVFEWCAHWLGV